MNKETPTFFNPYKDLRPKERCHSVDVASDERVRQHKAEFDERARQLKAELDTSRRSINELLAKATARDSKIQDIKEKAEAIEKTAAMFLERAQELDGSFEPEEKRRRWRLRR